MWANDKRIGRFKFLMQKLGMSIVITMPSSLEKKSVNFNVVQTGNLQGDD